MPASGRHCRPQCREPKDRKKEYLGIAPVAIVRMVKSDPVGVLPQVHSEEENVTLSPRASQRPAHLPALPDPTATHSLTLTLSLSSPVPSPAAGAVSSSSSLLRIHSLFPFLDFSSLALPPPSAHPSRILPSADRVTASVTNHPTSRRQHHNHNSP